MRHHGSTRRTFLRGGLAGGAAFLGLGDLSFLSALPPVPDEDVAGAPDAVRLRPEIEPLVRLLEDTPRGRVLEEVAARIRRGLSYREVLAALQLAGVRNVQPRPSVGFKFHAVLVVNSAHLASVSGPPSDRWLPIFWAIDDFKSSQARDVDEGNWTMPAVDESALPAPHRASEAFAHAMSSWDESAADVAVAQLARSAGASEVYEHFWRLGIRDFRSIGHKAIFVANSWRALQTIGWQHAEAIVRSLTYALLMHEGENPADRDADADRPFRQNLELAGEIRGDWLSGKPYPSATRDLLALLRDGSAEDACREVVRLLNRGIAPSSIYDALFAFAAEMVLRQPGIISLHGVTTTNAIHYAFSTTARDETRRLALLQNAAFLPLFRETMTRRGRVGDAKIDEISRAAPGDSGAATGDGGAAEEAGPDAVFTKLSEDRDAAVSHALGVLSGPESARELITSARRMVFLKGRDAHDYKFSSAVLEDYYHIGPEWRDRYLAASVPLFRGAGEPDSGVVERTRAAFAT